MRNADRILVTKPEGKEPIGWPRHKWEGNIKMNFTEIGFEDVDWVYHAQDQIQWQALWTF